MSEPTPPPREQPAAGEAKQRAAQPNGEDALPTARVERPRRLTWVWLIPAIALVFAAALFVNYGLKRGPVITVVFSSGDGIRPGDTLRCLGIVVGEVEQVRLLDELAGVAMDIRLDPSAAADVARAGSRFWVVQPRVGPGGVEGLETLAGPRYLAVAPGGGERQRQFVGLDEPPAVERLESGGLEITLLAERQRGLRVGSPVLYRGIVIGSILSVGLASDGTHVEARAYIQPIYTGLVTSESRFWMVGGAAFDMGLRGVRVEVESLRTLIEGGVALATPEGGRPVRTGQQFPLRSQPDDAWLTWSTPLPVGTELLPEGATAPAMQRVSVTRREGLLRIRRERSGWLLPTQDGLLGPADLLDSEAYGEVEVAGRAVPLEADAVREAGPLAILNEAMENAPPWPADRIRRLEEAEDCVVIADRAAGPRPLAAGHLQPASDGMWAVSAAVSFDADWHGAAVLSRDDGRLVGILLVQRDRRIIAPLPQE